MVLGFIFASAAGIGMVILMEAMDQSIRTEKALAAVTGSPPLVSIPYIKNPREQEKSRPDRRLLIFGVVAVLMVVIALVSINYFYKPLDVIWYMILRKLGLG
jgi:succinoglycan biosynthesis transport protein ExoP